MVLCVGGCAVWVGGMPTETQGLSLVQHVQVALAEDLGSGDVSSALLSKEQELEAALITREFCVLCGCSYVDEVFRQIDARVILTWHHQEGAYVQPQTCVATVKGPGTAVLMAERTALNFLQTLSAVSTQTASYVNCISGTRAQIYDTRKTLPGWRMAQKHAVRIGGGYNHRMGLYDAFLIKENHIRALGSITACVTKARQQHPELPLEVEIEKLDQLDEALACKVPLILLDNFDLNALTQAVKITAGRTVLEASGGVDMDQVRLIAETGVDRIAVGALTKHIQAIDFTLQVCMNR